MPGPKLHLLAFLASLRACHPHPPPRPPEITPRPQELPLRAPEPIGAQVPPASHEPAQGLLYQSPTPPPDIQGSSPVQGQFIIPKKLIDLNALQHGGSVLTNIRNHKYLTLLNDARDRREHHGQLSVLGMLPKNRLRSLMVEAQPPPIDGFAVVPENELVWNQVFEGPPQEQSDLNHASNARHQLSTFGIRTQTSDLPRNGAQFRTLLMSSTASIYTIIGHNSNGTLRIPPKHGISIAEMAEICAAAGKHCLFLSCKSFSLGALLGVRRNINYEDAAQLTAHIRSLLQVTIENKLYVADALESIRGILDEYESEKQLRLYVRFMAPSGAGILGSGALFIIGDQDDSNIAPRFYRLPLQNSNSDVR